MSGMTNRDGWVEACVKAMGEERGSLFGLLCKDLWELNHEYETYVRLFGPHNKHFALLNESAPDFFGLTQRLLFDSLALRIARLADPAASNQGTQPNLTMARLVKDMDKGSVDASVLGEIEDSLRQFRDSAKPFITWRHKVIAHSDLGVAQKGFPPAFTGQQIKEAERWIARLLRLIGSPYNLFVNSQRGQSDVRKLIKYLRTAEHEIELQRKVEDAIIGGWHVDATNSIGLPESIVRAAEVQAGLRGVSVEEWISRVLVERLDTAEGASEYFRNRAAGATGDALRRALDAVPNNPPDPGDEL